MKREVHILSYFSLPTDLAAELRDWPEFLDGQDYSVNLKSLSSGEEVAVRLVKDGEESSVSVSGCGSGMLFDKVLGRVTYALAAHSDNLMVDRVA